MNDTVCLNTKIDELNKTIHDFSIKEKVYIADIASLKEQVRSLQVKLFGRSSEARIVQYDRLINR